MTTPEAVRTFLVVVDRSAEFKAALRYSCRRAMRTQGAVALFHALPPTEFHHFSTIGELMDHEAKTEAERLLQQVAADVHRQTGRFPSLHIRQGVVLEQLLAVIGENPGISMLVLGAGSGAEGPGPLVSALSGKLAGKILIPVTIVPGDLDDARIDAIS
jgi:nucleotide-binding universal stress UspA family protein